MTTFQDQQPQSRRAARQSERADTAEPAVGAYSDPSEPREMWDTTARRAAQLVPPSQQSDDASAVAGGRRAAAPAQPAGEPLDYVTQQKPPIPTYDGPSFRPRGDTPAPVQDDLPPTQAMPIAERPAFRPRDFSPEGRRSAAPDAPAAAPGWTQPYDASELDYHTQNRSAVSPPAPSAPAASAPSAPAASAPSAPAAPIAEVPPTVAPAWARPVESAEPPISEIPDTIVSEHTLTRRELRAMQAAEAAAAVPELQEPPRPEAVAAEPVAAEPIAAEQEQAWPFAGLSSEPAAPVATDAFGLPAVAPEPEANTGLTSALTEFDALAANHEPAVQTPAPFSAPEATVPAAQDEAAPWTPPLGHWSTQLDEGDPEEHLENTLSRTVGGTSLTTSALVLPSIPDGDIRGPLTGTGEIMLTGSIDLPQSFAATGASGRLEAEGMDKLFESHDAEMVSTDSAPVSAIKAISTQSGSNIGHAPKPKGTRALTALLISAASMGVVVVGLLVVALVTGVF